MKKNLPVILALVTLCMPLSVDAAAANASRIGRTATQTLRQQLRNKSWDARRADALRQQVLETQQRLNALETYRAPQTVRSNRFPGLNTNSIMRMPEQMNGDFMQPVTQASIMLTPEQQNGLDEARQQFIDSMDASQQFNAEQDARENAKKIDKRYKKLQDARDGASRLLELIEFHADALAKDDLKVLGMVFKRKFESLDPLDLEQLIETWNDYANELVKIAKEIAERREMRAQKARMRMEEARRLAEEAQMKHEVTMAQDKKAQDKTETGSSWKNTVRETYNAAVKSLSNAETALKNWWNSL